jgi:hypothetical protein
MNKFSKNDVIAFLTGRYEAARRYQTSKGVSFQITFDQYLTLFTQARRNILLAKLNKSGVEGAERFFRHTEKGWVLSWISGKPAAAMTVADVKIMTRNQSKKNSQFKPGDTHTEKAKQAIGAAKRGVKRKPESVELSRQAHLNSKRSPEAKAKMRAKALEREARKRAEKAALEQVSIVDPEAEQPVMDIVSIVTATKPMNDPLEVLANIRRICANREPHPAQKIMDNIRLNKDVIDVFALVKRRMAMSQGG